MKFTRILLASALVLGLAACDNSQKDAQQAADAASKAAQDAAVATQKAADEAAMAAKKASSVTIRRPPCAAGFVCAVRRSPRATRYDLILRISPKHAHHVPHPDPD